MSIRIKLVLAYVVMVILSTFILIVAGISIFTNVFKQTTESVFVDPEFSTIITKVVDVVSDLKQAEEYNPDQLTDSEFIKDLTKDSQFFNGGLIVKNNNKLFNYSELPDHDDFYNYLLPTDPKDTTMHPPSEEVNFEYDGKKYFYIDYTFSTIEEPITYYFIADITDLDFVRSERSNGFFGILLMVLAVLSLPLLLIIKKDIIEPIRTLNDGVEHIKKGNLDFRLNTKKNNEIGEVIHSFETMRIELKRSIEKQVSFEENRKELISSISHDLKTPITSIKGHVEGIRDGVANTPEKLEKYLSVIYQQSRDMDQLIDDLFLFSKLDLNKLPFEMQEEVIKPFITSIVSEMKLGWEDDVHQLNLHLNLEDDVKVRMDVQKMRRVFINIIQNAMKYNDKDVQTIDIHVNVFDHAVQFVVSDNGHGIAGDQINSIFERFYRVDESRNKATGGTGLGLAISKQIIEQHGGTIKARSQVDVGTKMIIELEYEG